MTGDNYFGGHYFFFACFKKFMPGYKDIGTIYIMGKKKKNTQIPKCGQNNCLQFKTSPVLQDNCASDKKKMGIATRQIHME